MLLFLLPVSAFASDPPPASVSPQMHERYALLDAVRAAIIEGDYFAARRAAKALARRDGTDLPADWAPRADGVRVAAREAVAAPDLVQLADRAARVANACAECHAAVQGGPDPAELGAIPAQGWTEGTNMRLHAWASDTLWLALLARNDEVWRRGAAELASEPIALRFREPPVQEAGRAQLEQRLYVIANRALEVTAAEERAVLYGEMLSTCAECHTTR